MSKIYIGLRKKLGYDNEMGSGSYLNKALYFKPEGSAKYFQLDLVYVSSNIKSQNRVNNKCLTGNHDYDTLEDDGVTKKYKCSICGHRYNTYRKFIISNIYHNTGLPEDESDYREASADDIPTSALRVFDLLDNIN